MRGAIYLVDESTYVVARYSCTAIVDVLPYEASVESERRERDGSSAGSASVGGPRRVELKVGLVCCLTVCLLLPLLRKDVIGQSG